MEWIFLTLCTAAALIMFIFYLLLQFTLKLNYWKKQGIKYVPNFVPFFGNMLDCVVRKYSRAGEQMIWYNMFPEEKYIGFYMFIMPVLMLRDPETIHNVLTKDFSYFHNRGIPFEEDHDPLSSHLINLRDERWKHLRKKLTPCFSSSKLKIMFDSWCECGNELANFIEKKIKTCDCFDIHDAMAKFSIDVTGRSIYGLNFNSLNNPESEFRHLGRDIFKSHFRFVLRFFLRQVHSKLASLLRIRVVDPKLEAFFINFVKDVVAFRRGNDTSKKDFLQILIDMRNEDIAKNCGRKTLDHPEGSRPVTFSDKDLASNMAIFFVAGFETSSTTMGLCFLELASNPKVQENLLKEILYNLEINNNMLSYDVVKNMSYLEMVINETMRKYPVAISILRECKKPYLFPDSTVTVQEKKSVIIPVYAIHHDPKYYPNPEVFDPERFSEINKSNILPGTYLPFGEGPRMCIGLTYAMMEMKTAICKILHLYKFEISERTKYPIEFDRSLPILTPKDGIWLKISKRETNS